MTHEELFQHTINEQFERHFMADTRLEARDALRAILYAFEMAKKDPSFKCPSYLMAAIECASTKL